MDNPQPAQTESRARWLYWAAAIALMLGLTALYQSMIGPRPMQLAEDSEGRAMVVLPRSRNGHYLAVGAINGQPVKFLVDTGATDVAVSDGLARAIGLEFGPRMTVLTAAGPVRGWQTRLDSVQLGELALGDVRATIAPGLGNQALLGMSFLKHFTITQEGENLVIALPGVSRL